ncbi:MAG: SpoIID/LytB domain-containing protein [Chlamydiales bacterium]|nr:SpoIID/LytB domain-containing protein [Chlamydiia bacterium]MCP5504304.1 SpoIID/LytB domain-containing protein [Chlamydiales bacterium]
MKAKFLLFLFFLPLLAFAGEKTSSTDMSEEKPATIKLLLEKGTDGILLEAKGPYAIYNPENGKKESSGRWGKRFYLYPHEEGIKWGENFLGIYQLQIVPTSPETTFLVNGVQYRGAIEVYNIENTLSIINEVDVETYVKTILNEHVSPTLSPNVLDAIAIIARTDAYYKALLNYDAFWHITKEEAGYHGNALILQNLVIDRAVDNTKYLVMTYEDQPFPGSWNENCGGKTASYSSIFRKNTVTPEGVESKFAIKNRKDTRWSLTVDTQELAKVVKTNRITGMDLYIDHVSGKVYATRLHDGSHTEDVDFAALQNKLGKDKLKSNDFNVSIKGNIALFEGYGEGNGVGLCLYSATQMAERGDEAPAILAQFFPNTTIEKMRNYPKAIVSSKKRSFVSPKQKEAAKKKYRLLHK